MLLVKRLVLQSAGIEGGACYSKAKANAGSPSGAIKFASHGNGAACVTIEKSAASVAPDVSVGSDGCICTGFLSIE